MTSHAFLADPQPWVRDWFRANGLSRTIDECAKAAARERISVTLAVISRIRTELKQADANAKTGPETQTLVLPARSLPVELDRAKPFAERLVISGVDTLRAHLADAATKMGLAGIRGPGLIESPRDRPEPVASVLERVLPAPVFSPVPELPAAPEPVAVAVEPEPEQPATSEPAKMPDPNPLFRERLTVTERKSLDRRAMAAAKRKWLNDVLEYDPTTTGRAILDNMQRVFGSRLEIKYVYETCRTAAEVAGIKRRSGGPKRKVAPSPRAAAHEVRAPLGADVLGDDDGEPRSAPAPSAPSDGDPVPGLIRDFLTVLKARGVISLRLVLRDGEPAELQYEVIQKRRVTL